MSICKSNKGVDGVVSVTICSSGMRSWECIGFIEDLDGINVLVDVALRTSRRRYPGQGQLQAAEAQL